ncbi:GTP cyclohydrolase I FolE [Microbacterium sp. SYP-A9085]|jgi:GTP cyclohydrolase I|uniref:GTP cyclohydrolase I n=1 Tax=Microbacterium sp. SYP-A9085 TaxID=2664454 RepID=UPI00129AC528|nr:GTP cyclohydrolase I [Microbacterium sp. SYP-A9085]MRH29380.1 GTP cyclohydrolase I FolE [Microbacterium sp. SYP-A9085]
MSTTAAPLAAVEDPDEQTGVDVVAAERAVADLLRALGRDVTDPHLAETPRRVVAALREMTEPDGFMLTTFPNDSGYEDLVLVRDIPFTSVCEHHLLPFRGVAHVGYLPGERIVGLSKLARVVELFAHDLQVQETLTAQIADHLMHHLAPRGVGVVLQAEHMCMSLRGVRSAGTTTVTSAFRGALRDDDQLRARFAPTAH